jgi:predicted transposase/invertase (TIGR01784 family)
LPADKQWALFIDNIDKKEFAERIIKHLPKEEFRVAVNTLSGISKSREEQIRYISRLKFQKDYTHSLSTAKKEGILETAVNFLKNGFTVEQVANGTKLTIEEIEKLKLQIEE